MRINNEQYLISEYRWTFQDIVIRIHAESSWRDRPISSQDVFLACRIRWSKRERTWSIRKDRYTRLRRMVSEAKPVRNTHSLDLYCSFIVNFDVFQVRTHIKQQLTRNGIGRGCAQISDKNNSGDPIGLAESYRASWQSVHKVSRESFSERRYSCRISVIMFTLLLLRKINIPYARILYIAYEKRITDMCMIIIEDVCARLKRIEVDSRDSAELSLGTTLFELYLTLQRYATWVGTIIIAGSSKISDSSDLDLKFASRWSLAIYRLGQMLCAEGQLENMKIQIYHEWFRAGVAHWLDIAVYKALKRIDKAVEIDSLQTVDDSVQYSSSAVDTLTTFYQIKVFWTQLAWPDVEGSYTFIAKIIDVSCWEFWRLIKLCATIDTRCLPLQ